MPAPADLPDATPQHLAARAADVLLRVGSSSARALVGITGAPGAGKSTVAEQVVEALCRNGVRAVLVPMDGFHLAQRELERLGSAPRKGAPDTFDAAGFVALLARLRSRTQGTVWAPEFRREIEEAVAGAIGVTADVDVVVTEGNYLLLPDGEWAAVRELLDEVWFVAVDDDVRRERLAARHQRYGRGDDEAWARTLGSDEANARVVDAARERADLVIWPAPPSAAAG
ncbi:nucleoside/nucleotide kinase family protein [Angustibacter peucedani]